ncbi:MAG: hypothetical protein MUC50_23825 [Myxococcota bacterium]|nr:hypothetical protein [Myxococcota bacterium]
MRELFHRGELPGHRLGAKLLRFRRDAVLQLLAGQGCGSRSRRR